jgi:NTE family protein
MMRRPKLGIALGSGSARGWAHIGVLLALTEEGIVVDYVAGCSMGAMVGAAFAAGRIDELQTWALALDWRRVVGLLDVGLWGGVFKGDRLIKMFQGQFVECQFSELPMPFAAVATDLATGNELWLREGRVCDAVRASCTIPGLFRPVLRDGRYVVDGSVVNPIPVSLCRAMGAEVVIAVDLGTHMMRRFPAANNETTDATHQRRGLFSLLSPSPRVNMPRLPSIADTLLGTIDIMQESIAKARLLRESPDVVLTPSLGQVGPFEYHRAALAIAEGREAVAQMLPAIRQALAIDDLAAVRTLPA